MRLILSILTIGFFITHGLSQKSDNQTPYIVKANHINFLYQDSVIKFTILIEPNGYFYFKKGFLYNSKNYDTKYRVENGKPIKDSLIIDTINIIKVVSRFENLLKDSTSIKNYYPHPYIPEPFYYELEYSYILHNLIEPNLSKESGYKTLRLVIPKETSGTPRNYYAIRVNFSTYNLVHKVGKFDANSNYQLIINDSLLLSYKQIDKLESKLNLVDFGKVDVFTEVGIDIYPKYLIEYFDGSDYYVFEKQLFSKKKDDKELNRLISEILMVKNKIKTK